MQLKEYQKETLKAVRVYLEELAQMRAEVMGPERQNESRLGYRGLGGDGSRRI